MTKGPLLAFFEGGSSKSDPPCLDESCPTCGELAGIWCEVAYLNSARDSTARVGFVCYARCDLGRT